MGSAALAFEGGWIPPSQPVRHLHVVPDLVEVTPAFPVEAVEHAAKTDEKFNQWYGSLALNSTVELSNVETAEQLSPVDLLERMKAAKAGNPEATRSVKTNVSKAVAEGFFKRDFVTRVSMERAENGDLIQFGQTNESIHRNAITMRPNRHQILKDITKAEARNAHYIRDSVEAGTLQDHYFFVASMVPKGVPEKDLGHKGDGYFLDSMTFVVQATTEQPNGNVTTDSAFMAGVEAADNASFDERMEQRFDVKAMSKVYERLGLEVPTTVEGFIKGVYIHKDLAPNGMADFLLWIAEAKDEVQGKQVERKVEDFQALILESKRKEASVAEVSNKVLEGLLAVADKLETPMQAVKYMWELVKNHGVQESLSNKNIDPRVFGQAAAASIVKARHLVATGRAGAAELYMRQAHEVAEVTGCGGGGGGKKSGSSAQETAEFNPGQMTKAQLAEIFGSDDLGPRAFYCPDGHLNVRPERNKTIPHCQSHGCDAQVAC